MLKTTGSYTLKGWNFMGYERRAGRAAQAVDLLPSKHEALSSNPSTTKKKKKKEKG
jgi:hypothetical protein